MSAAEKFISTDKMAAILDVDKRGIYSLIKKGQIPHIKVGGSYRFDPEAVISYLTVLPEEDRTKTIRHRERNGKKKKRQRIDWSKYE
jgi:excisionase family DNA binding protein